MRRFDNQAVPVLPEVIAIDEYKGDINEGKYQVIRPLDTLLNHRNGEKLFAEERSQG